MELQFFSSAHHLIGIYICTKFYKKYSIRYYSYRADTLFIAKISKGLDSVKLYVCGVTVLFLCTSSDGGLYLYKVP